MEETHKIKIKLGKSFYLVIDLTQSLSLDTEVYPGDPKPQKEIFSEIEKTGYQYHTYKIGDHNFQPHADAPNHQNPELQNKGIESFDLEYCFNNACLIDLSNAKETKFIDGIRYLSKIKKEHLEQFTIYLKNVGAVLIRTGYDKWLESNKPHMPENLPYLTKEAAEFISSFKNIKVFGTDSLTIDSPGKHFSHKNLKDKLIIESMVHLDRIPKEKHFNFELQTTPVKIKGATGGPVVAYAFIEI